MIVRGSVDEDGLRFCDAESFVEIGVIQRGIEMKFCGVAIEDRAVWFSDGDDLDFWAIERVGEEAVGVSVNESGDDYAEGRLGVSGREHDGEQKCDCDKCAVAKESGWHASGSEKPEDDSTGLELGHIAVHFGVSRSVDEAAAGPPQSKEGRERNRSEDRPLQGQE